MSTLFGHKKGSFTGAQSERAGLLREADNGMLFLDEIGELGLDEQTMLLRALEDKTFLPLGADKPVTSNFELICGTNCDLRHQSSEGLFRDDLLARINIWMFELPGLKDRKDDIEPNVDYELTKFSSQSGSIMRFTAEARSSFLKFSKSPEATWKGNFRDLNAAILRMSTLSDTGRITEDVVFEEIQRLKRNWIIDDATNSISLLNQYLSDEQLTKIDPFDKPQLSYTLEICRKSNSLSEAGRELFSVSRSAKKIPNDADRLRKYLAKFNLTWQMIKN
jgi:transcriptional regulatory protein RtcR